MLQAVLYCVIIFGMKVELDKYRGKKICVAVSGGRDSMALLHYMRVNAEAFGITLCAVNCDHMLRGKASESDSRFVKDICEKWEIPLDFYKTDCAALAKKRVSAWRHAPASGGGNAISTQKSGSARTRLLPHTI